MYLYIKFGLLIKDLAIVALTAEMIDTVVDIVIVLVVVLWQRSYLIMVMKWRVIGTTIVFVLSQVCVR